MTSFYTDIAKFAVKDLKIMSVFAESTLHEIAKIDEKVKEFIAEILNQLSVISIGNYIKMYTELI